MPADLQSVAEQLATLSEAASKDEITDMFCVYRMQDGSFNYCFNTTDQMSLMSACAEALRRVVDELEQTPEPPRRLN